MDDAVPYETLPPPPERFDGAGVLVRLVDGLAFRYRWSTEGLSEELADFRPCEGSMSLAGVMTHVAMLVNWLLATVETHGRPDPPRLQRVREELSRGREGGDELTMADARRATLAGLCALRALIAESDDASLAALRIAGRDDLPVWNLVNGPLADALTHVGQIASWRRMAGDPAPRADVFRGKPPAPAV